MPWTPEQVRRHKAAAKAVADINHSTSQAVDNFTDSVETLLLAISQREMSPDQVDRLAAVLQRAERDLLRRCQPSHQPRTAATGRLSRTRSGGAARAPDKAA